jgi:hypothetical protein
MKTARDGYKTKNNRSKNPRASASKMLGDVMRSLSRSSQQGGQMQMMSMFTHAACSNNTNSRFNRYNNRYNNSNNRTSST